MFPNDPRARAEPVDPLDDSPPPLEVGSIPHHSGQSPLLRQSTSRVAIADWQLPESPRAVGAEQDPEDTEQEAKAVPALVSVLDANSEPELDPDRSDTEGLPPAARIDSDQVDSDQEDVMPLMESSVVRTVRFSPETVPSVRGLVSRVPTPPPFLRQLSRENAAALASQRAAQPVAPPQSAGPVPTVVAPK